MILEERWQSPASDIAALVDGGRQYSAAMLAIPDRIIGAATEEGDAKRSARDYHFSVSFHK